MRCRNCGKKLREKEKFCTVCGYYNDGKDDDFQVDGVLFDNDLDLSDDSEIEENNELDDTGEFDLKANASGTRDNEFYYKDEKFLEAFIGEDYKLIKKSPFNIYAFLLNWMYVLYRKMYVIGIVGMLITGIIILLQPKFLIIYLLFVMLILGLSFNKVYILISKIKVERIVNKNAGTDNFMMENICKKKGGVKVSYALLIYFIFLILVFFGLFTVSYNSNHNEKFWKENSENRATCSSLLKIANRDLESNEISGTLKEGICVVYKTISGKDYDVYLKINDNSKTFYLYYKTEKEYLVYNNTTSDLRDLEAKSLNKTITEDEKKELSAKKNIEEAYFNATKKSTDEDLQIKNKTNDTEKKNYIFSSSEITR